MQANLLFLSSPINFHPRAVTEARDDIKYNDKAIDLLMQHNLLLLKEFCTHLAHLLHEKINSPHFPVAILMKNPLFSMQINLGVQICTLVSYDLVALSN